MISNLELANLIFPEITETIDDLEKRYPLRDLPEGAEVTRFAPSPTGFLHTGSLFTAMICRKVASQSKGVFYIRLEDTDTKREIAGSGEQLLEQLRLFNIVPDEGYMATKEVGNYGPYTQSKRADIYKVCIKELIRQGRAYPCFLTQEEIEDIRKKQEAQKLQPGIYGEFALYRDLSNDERVRRIKNGDPYVIRFKSNGNHLNKIQVSDLVRGDFEIMENDLDVVILKGDGLPTYHFAHAVDDHFMRTTTVMRGEEWISSLPIHVELFDALGFKRPRYAHLPVIMKLDENGHKRKLSKRLDSEAAVSFFLEDGYPSESLIVYLMTIMNSNFEQYLFDNDFRNLDDFMFSFDKMSLDGALFDITKMQFFSKEILSRKNKHEMRLLAEAYASKYNKNLLDLINRDPDYFEAIMNIDREKENPRKDYYKFGDMDQIIGFFYNDIYEKLIKEELPFNPNFDKHLIIKMINKMKDLPLDKDESEWFNQMKEWSLEEGFAPSGKFLKKEPDKYIGTVGDVAEMLRITLTGRKNAPTLFAVMQILGKSECDRRINQMIEYLSR